MHKDKFVLPNNNTESPTLSSRTFLISLISLNMSKKLIKNTRNTHYKYKSYFHSRN